MVGEQTKWRPAHVVGGILVVFSIMAAGFHLLAEYAAVSPHGTDLLLWLRLPLVAPCLLVPLVVPASLVGLLFRKQRPLSAALLVGTLLFASLSIIAMRQGGRIRTAGFERLAERSRPLIQAIEAYARDRGDPPANLEHLVPEYLPAVPKTGMAAYPEYEYFAGSIAVERYGQPWVLSVFCPSGGINFDQFLYFPDGDYPEQGHGGWLQRIGDWAYVHE
jgi:hypothetical protein